MAALRTPIEPLAPRWEPTPDPADIHVPGLDTNASVHDQIDQIEQLITIKLQNIDENFSKIQNLLANKLLPAVKRYAVGTQPVRDAAAFWTSFYEQAAQIRIPTADDYSTVNEQPSESQETEDSAGPSTSHERPQYNQTQDNHDGEKDKSERQNEASNITVNTDTSFGRGAFSSTPATARMGQSAPHSFATQQSEDSSFPSSIESPLERLDRNFRDFSREEAEPSATQADETQREDRLDRTLKPSSAPRSAKVKEPETLHRSVLRRNLYSVEDVSSIGAVALSPGKSKTSSAAAKNLNPYLASDTQPNKWSGVVDLRDPSVIGTPSRKRQKSPRRQAKPPTPVDEGDSLDDLDLPSGMSPPQLMSPARPPRSAAELGLTLGRTPLKDATGRIAKGAMSGLTKQSGGTSREPRNYYAHEPTESTFSTMPTPSSLAQYGRSGGIVDTTGSSVAMDSSLESMMHRLNKMTAPSTVSATPAFQMEPVMSPPKSRRSYHPSPAAQTPERENYYHKSNSESPYDMIVQPQPVTPGFEDYQDYDSMDDDYNEVNDTAHPSAAFLMASGRRINADDSFDSSSSDSLNQEQEELDPNQVHPHPFARVAQAGRSLDDMYDSFDDDSDQNIAAVKDQEPSETLFGIKGDGARPNEPLRLRGTSLNDSLDYAGSLPLDSPTPAMLQRK